MIRVSLSKCPKPKDSDIIADGYASLNIVLQPGVLPLRFQRGTSSSRCEIKFQPGNWSLLAEYVGVEHRDQFVAVFSALPQVEKQAAFENFVLMLAKSVLGPDGDGSALVAE